MTPTRMRECLDAIGLSQRGLASLIAYPEGDVRGWARGRGEVPVDVAALLELWSHIVMRDE